MSTRFGRVGKDFVWITKPPDIKATNPVLATVNQRLRDDSTALNTDGGWLAAEDANYTTLALDTVYRLRMTVDETAGKNGDFVTDGESLVYRRNGGTWTALGDGNCDLASSAHITGTGTCGTQLLSAAPAGSFDAEGPAWESGSSPPTNVYAKDDYWETEHAFQLPSTGAFVSTDTVEFRWDNGRTDATEGNHTKITLTVSVLENVTLDATASTAYAITGTAAGLTQTHLDLAATGDSYAITGFDAVANLAVPATVGSFAITGTAASLEYGPAVDADTAAFVITGTDVTLTLGADVVITADAGSHVITGTAATLTVLGNVVLTADSGTYDITGTAANLEYHHEVDADTVAFAITGTAAGLTQTHLDLAATGTSYAITGFDAVANLAVPATVGAYTVTGQDATLTVSGIITLTADVGSFSVTGTAASLEQGYAVDASTVAFSVTGTAANLEYGPAVDADTVAYVITGADATLTYASGGDVVITADVGSFAITGFDAIGDLAVPATAGSFVITGGVTGLAVEYPGLMPHDYVLQIA